MSVHTRTLLLAVCLCSAMPALSAEPAAAVATVAEDARAFDVRGRVADAAGKPVADAEVWLCRVTARPAAASVVAQARSAADGSFVLSAPTASKGVSYAVVARHSAQGVGFATFAASGAPKSDVALTLATAAPMQVTVTDTAGQPVADAEVYLVQAAPKGLGRPVKVPGNVGIFTARSDAQGKAQLTVPADSEVRLAARKPGFADAEGTDKLVLCPGGTITGAVTFSDGTPAANVLVSYLYTGGQGSLESFATTDAEGRYTLKDVAAEGYRQASGPADDGDPFANVGHITASLSETAPANPDIPTSVSESASVKPSGTLTKNLVLPKAHELSGTVVDATTGKPLPGVQVNIHGYSPRGGTSRMSRVVTTDKEGRFAGRVAHGDNASVQVLSGSSLLLDDFQQGTPNQNVQNVRADTKDITLRLKLIPTRRVTGKLVGPDGKAVAGTIYADPRTQPVSTADGMFTLTQLPADRPAGLYAKAGAFGGMLIVKPEQQEIALQLQPVVERQFDFVTVSGKPVPGLNITCYPKLGNTWWYQAQTPTPATDASGSTRVKGLVPGVSYVLNWNASNGTDVGSGNTTITVAAGETAQPHKVAVREYTQTLAGKVVNSKGEPVANAHFQFRDFSMFKNNDYSRAHNVTTKADGSFKLEQLAEGVLEGQVWAGNYRQLNFAIPSGSTDAKLVLRTQQEPAQHEVLICDEQGAPLADTPVLLVYREERANKVQQEPSTTDANGMVDLSGIKTRQGISVICDLDGSNLAAVQLEQHNDGRHRLVVTPALPSRQVRIVDDAGKPLPNIQVKVTSFSAAGNLGGEHAQLYSWPEELLAVTGMVQKTDASGLVAFPRVSHRQYVGLSLSSPVYGDRHQSVQASDVDTPAEIRLSIPGTLTGKLSFPADAKVDVRRYNVELRPTQAGQHYSENVRNDGTFNLKHVVPGTYTVALQSWGRDGSANGRYKLAPVPPITIESAKTVQLDLVLKEGIRVRGRLEYNRPANAKENAQVYLDEDSSGRLQNYLTDASGNFELYVAAPGEYRLMYHIPGSDGPLQSLDPIRVPSTQPIDDLVLKVPAKAK